MPSESEQTLVNEKGDKVRKQGKSFQLTAIQKLCHDACRARLMLHPYIEQAAKTLCLQW